ncbi:hypothetical protein Sango_2328600 [Sesamum angolense]|uniref:Uncharacterized protein n=1 Tax=Sesamum angolense TaxID=2727404 RepID=A0AAE2BLL2_9LAMI|nr:hypothetical protein Sango_2328600 [Sesamum angolense]
MFYLELLIEELQNLWHIGVLTRNIAKDEKFTIRATLMWTVNDQVAYGMASRWSTAGVMGCQVWVGLERSNSRTSRLGIEDPIETCTKYYICVSSVGDVGRPCSISGLVGKSRAYEDCILDMASGGCVVRHGHHKPYPVQSKYIARTVDSKRGSVPYHYMTEGSPMHLKMV